MRRRWILRRQLKHHEKWLANRTNEKRLRDKSREELSGPWENLGRNRQHVFKTVCLLLNWYACWPSTAGAVKVLHGESEGWSQLRLAFLCHAWKIRLRFAVFDEEKDYAAASYLLVNTLLSSDQIEPHWLAEAIATNDDARAHGFGRKLIQCFHETGVGDPYFFYLIPFQPFMFKLYCLWVGEEISFSDDVADPLGPYQPLIDAWDDEDEFAEALVQACDYHCQESFDRAKGYPPFVWGPYDVYPVEILAIQRVRRDLGLPTPEIDHPLLASALCHPPETPPEVRDPLLEDVAARLKEEFPQIGDPW